MRIKSMILGCSFVLLTICLVPGSSSAYHSMNYFFESNANSMCTHCHEGEGNPGVTAPDCIKCHTETAAPPYNVDVAPGKTTHSSEALGYQYGNWSRECLDCHDPHNNNGMTRNGGLTNDDYKLVEFMTTVVAENNGEFTAEIKDVDIKDTAWSDPDTWINKTSDERGLVVLFKNKQNKTFWFKLTGYTPADGTEPAEITFLAMHTSFGNLAFRKDRAMSLVYGQQIKDEVEVDGIPVAVTFGGPRDMAKDESESGYDSTPDGICQVCHTQTNYWRNDGSRADHFNGWRCTICHPHDQGFKAVTPEGCICPEGETCGN